MNFKPRTLNEIAAMICGNFDREESLFHYRTSKYLTEFFEECGTHYRHDGYSRGPWVSDVLKEILSGPRPNIYSLPDTFSRIIRQLMDQGDATNEGPERKGALEKLNLSLSREGFEAFYAPDNQCYLRHIATKTETAPSPNPHRPFSTAELEKRALLIDYLNKISEDDL